MTYAALETAAKQAGYSVECVENTRLGILIFRIRYGKYHIRKSITVKPDIDGPAAADLAMKLLKSNRLAWDTLKTNSLKTLLRQVTLMPFDKVLRDAEKEGTRQ